jgi:hypothetical protein
MPPATWSLIDRLAHLRSWLRPSEVTFNRDDPRQDLELRLTQHEPDTLDHVASCVWGISLWEYNLGAFQVLEGDPSGWGHLRLGVEYEVWRLRILFHLHRTDEDRDRPFSVHRDVVCCAASAVALRENALADWCGALLLREFTHPDFLIKWGKSPLFPFMAWLYAQWRGRTFQTSQAAFRDLGVYQNVVTGWEDDAVLRNALLEACDYHCARTDSETNPEFWQSPYPVFPGEIIATQRVREEQTGRKVVVDHPLMNSPLGSVPDSVPKFEDPLLERFKERVIAEEGSRTDRAVGDGQD